MNNTSLHHRQTAPTKFRDPYIIAQVLTLLTQAEKNLIVSAHGAFKHKSYLWYSGYCVKNGQVFDISCKDALALCNKPITLFSALLAKADDEDIFEIVLNANHEVTKLALRVDLPTSPDTDIIIVLGGELEKDRLEYQSVRLVTWYLNKREDKHLTLQEGRYAS